MPELKKLIPGETRIAVINKGALFEEGKITEEGAKYNLYYGNVVYIAETDKRYHMKNGRYIAILNKFLESPVGQQYEKPTMEEIRNDIAACITPPDLPDPAFSEQDEQADSPLQPDNPALKEECEPEQVPVEDEQAIQDPGSSEIEKTDEEEREPLPYLELIDDEEAWKELERENRKAIKLFEKSKPRSILKGKKENRRKEETPETPPEKNGDNEEDFRLKKALGFWRAAAIVAIIAAIGIAFAVLAAGSTLTVSAGSSEVHIVSLNDTVMAGNAIPASSLSEAVISREEFKELSGNTTIDRNGNIKTDYPILWKNRNAVIGRFAADNLQKGDYLFNSDYSLLKTGTSMVELDVNGTVVKVPVASVLAATSDMKLYAIITSRDDTGRISNYAVNLGTLEFTGKSLRRILNKDGESILEEYLQKN